jgi:hypothetical protein
MSDGFLVIVTLDGKVVDSERFQQREEAEQFRERTVHEVGVLMDMGDPGTWEVFLTEVDEYHLFVPPEAGKVERVPDLAEQYRKMSASYREAGRMRLYHDRKEQIVKYLEGRRKDQERMQPPRG